MDNTLLLAIAGAILVVVVAVVHGHFEKQKRMKQMRAVAARLGYEFTGQEDGLGPALGGFAHFSQGYRYKTLSLLRAVADGATATIFDCDYWVGSGKNRRLRRQTMLLFESERLDLPAFALRPEGLSQKLKGVLGKQDIDFEDQPGFSAAYVLQGPDEPQIRALFGGEKPAFFARRRGLWLEGHGRKLLYYRAKKRISPKAIPSFVEDGLAVLNLLAGEAAPPPAGEPDSLAGLDELLAEIGTEEG